MPKKPAKKALAKKTMKKTKGGILIGLNQPALRPPTLQSAQMLKPPVSPNIGPVPCV